MCNNFIQLDTIKNFKKLFLDYKYKMNKKQKISEIKFLKIK